MAGLVRKTENHLDKTVLDWNVKHQNKQTVIVSVINVLVVMEGSSELLFACVKSNKLSQIYDWMNAKT